MIARAHPNAYDPLSVHDGQLAINRAQIIMSSGNRHLYRIADSTSSQKSRVILNELD